MLKHFLRLLMCNVICAQAFALTPKDPAYCAILQQVKPNMQIGDAFLILGPPHSFSQPPNLDPRSLGPAAKPAMQPQNSVNANDPAARQRVLASMAQDPILGAFIKAPLNSQNVLIWTFENNSLNVSVKTKGSTITDVKTNFTCP